MGVGNIFVVRLILNSRLIRMWICLNVLIRFVILCRWVCRFVRGCRLRCVGIPLFTMLRRVKVRCGVGLRMRCRVMVCTLFGIISCRRRCLNVIRVIIRIRICRRRVNVPFVVSDCWLFAVGVVLDRTMVGDLWGYEVCCD